MVGNKQEPMSTRLRQDEEEAIDCKEENEYEPCSLLSRILVGALYLNTALENSEFQNVMPRLSSKMDFAAVSKYSDMEQMRLPYNVDGSSMFFNNHNLKSLFYHAFVIVVRFVAA